MSMDAISEKIAHFIGAFELVEQEARMRADYDKFRAIKAAEDDANAINLRSLKAKESYKLEDVDAGVKMKPTPIPPMKPGPELDGVALASGVVLANGPHAPTLYVGEVAGQSDSMFMTPPTTTPNFTLPPPSSIAQVTYQVNTLSDNDSFGGIVAGAFQAVETMIAALQNVFSVVSQLSPLEMDLLPTSANWSMVVAEIESNAQTLETGTNETLTTSVLIGEDAQGTFADGAAIEEFTPFEDLLPAYIAEKRAEAEAEAEPHDPVTDGHDFAADFGKDESPFKVDDGHAVVAGANTLVNTASITSTWLDAEIIAVAGDVVRLDAISQVNVIIDHDSVTDALAPTDLADQSSTAANAAAIAVKSVAAAKAESEDTSKTEAKAAPDFSGAPANWTVVRYDGPVTQVNWVKQNTFTTDMDQAVVTFSGAATFLGLGENGLSNSFFAQELGYQYDLILVGGDLIDINLVSQLNIILDSDVVDIAATTQDQSVPLDTAALPSSQAAPAAETVVAKALTDVPTATATQADDTSSTQAASQCAQAPTASFIGESADGSSQQAAATNGLPEAAIAEDETVEAAPAEVAADTPEAVTDSPPPATESAVSTGDNLAYNQASIQTIGQDTDTAITQTFADVLDGFAQGIDYIPDEVVEEPAFEGTELLRVLYVDGNFTTVNMVEQVNVLGDIDQVHLARDDFAAALQEQIQITTGSNIAANIASIRDNGMDSDVMAQGETYSQALIHQANLIDTDLVETGTSIADLANEAVAFLTDEVNPDTMGDDIAAMANGMISDTFSQSDIMQTMLS